MALDFPFGFPYSFGELVHRELPTRGRSYIVTPEQQVVLRDTEGHQLMQWLSEDFTQLSWGRELRATSKCSLSAGSVLDRKGNAPPIVPWKHWLDVYSTDPTPRLYWTGPIQTISMDEYSTDINCSDVSVYSEVTRVPLTKSWDGVDPSVPALEMWNAMLTRQGLPHVVPIPRVDPYGNRFDCRWVKGEKLMNQMIQDLEQMAFKWTVVGGVPVLGPMPEDPIASLDKDDFVGRGLKLTRDGSRTFNDILLRGADEIASARKELYGLNLETIINLDTMFGLTNVNAAAREYVDMTGRFVNSISTPGGAVLNPHVNLDVNQLVPSVRFAVTAFGVRSTMELESLQVMCQSGQAQTAVTLTEVPDRTEIGDMLITGGSASFASGTRNSLNLGKGLPT